MNNPPPDQFTRAQIIMSDSAINAIADTYGDRDVLVQFLTTALSIDPLTHYIKGLDTYTDYMQRQSKHLPITNGKWTRKINFNSSNDEDRVPGK